MKDEIEVRSRFLSLGLLQGLSRHCKLSALPSRAQAIGTPEWAALLKIYFERAVSEVGGLGNATIMDDKYNLYEYETTQPNFSNGAEWLQVVADALGREPSKKLFVFYDTVIMVDQKHSRAKARMQQFTEKIKGQDPDSAVNWLCRNGGMRVNVASLITIDGIESQMLFTYQLSEKYKQYGDFSELAHCVQTSSLSMIDENMSFLGRLNNIDPDDGNKFGSAIEKQVRSGFLWLDKMHSEPLMELMQHFGFGLKSDIEEAIGKAIIRHSIGN